MKKKVVLIMTDTQRPDMLGCYGNKELKTPNIDKLASQGVRFDKAYTCQPVCGPARAALFTGLYPHSNGSFGNSMALSDNVKTIGQRLCNNGIKTAYIGKWHLDGTDYFGNGICPDGWDEKYWYDMRRYLEELTDEKRLESRKVETMTKKDISAEFTYGNRCSNRAIEFLENHSDDDFLLVVSYDEPHHPFLCPKEYIEMYKDYCFPKSENVWDRLEDKPEHHRAWAGDKINEDKDKLEIKSPYYFACNSFVDYEIGRVLSAIEQYAPDALVIYTADHGDMLSSHSLSSKGPAMYEEIVRIPLIIKDGNSTSSNKVYSSTVSHIDIVPTILEYCGIERAKCLEGKSLIKGINDNSVIINEHIFIEFGRYEIDHDGFAGFQPIRAVCDGHYKLVINLLSSDELYDLEKDPCEMKNLINNEEYKLIRNGLHDKILDWMNMTRDPFRGYHWERREWRSKLSKSLWNYTGYTRQRENELDEPRQLDYDTGLTIINTVRHKQLEGDNPDNKD